MSDPGRAEFQVAVTAPIGEVWQALRDPAEIRRWFGWDYDGLEAEIQQIFVDEAEASEDERTITWSHGDVFALEARGGETVVRVSRPAPAAGEWDDVYEGWLTFVQQLRFALERHPGEERRTFQLFVRTGRPATALGLEELASSAFGQRYELESPLGERLTGEIWYRSPHQIGLSVDAYGDGLLVVAAGGSPSRGMVVVTTYGLDEGAFGEIRERWTAWWQSTFPDETKR